MLLSVYSATSGLAQQLIIITSKTLYPDRSGSFGLRFDKFVLKVVQFCLCNPNKIWLFSYKAFWRRPYIILCCGWLVLPFILVILRTASAPFQILCFIAACKERSQVEWLWREILLLFLHVDFGLACVQFSNLVLLTTLSMTAHSWNVIWECSHTPFLPQWCWCLARDLRISFRSSSLQLLSNLIPCIWSYLKSGWNRDRWLLLYCDAKKENQKCWFEPSVVDWMEVDVNVSIRSIVRKGGV